MKDIEEYKHLEKLNINVSECGEVTRYRGGKFHIYRHQICRAGYRRVQFMVNGKRISTGVHRLVAIAFIPNPESKPDVNHKDGNKANNHYHNLEWVTEKENTRHAIENGQWNPASAGSNGGKIAGRGRSKKS